MLHEVALRLALGTENARGRTKGPAIWLGEWKNQMGSSMIIRLSGNEVQGNYTSVDSTTGQPIKSVKMCGYVDGDLISFIVLWPGGSQTAWTGQLVDDETNPRIKTLWHLATDIPDAEEPKRLWKSTLAGADEFTRYIDPTAG